jgi:hypothetical protein
LLQRGADIGAASKDGQTAATLIDLKGYCVNETGKLELKPGHNVGQVQDVREEEDAVDLSQNPDYLW